jgi:hypothetical protein
MAKPRSIAEIVAEAAKQPDQAHKVAVLRHYDSPVLRNLLRMAVDQNLKWLLPEGDVPFKPCEHTDQENMLYKEARMLYLFIEGGGGPATMKHGRREKLFIELLECLDSRDARFLVDVRNKQLPDGLTANDIRAAWPGLI